RPVKVAHPVPAREVQPAGQPGRRARVEPPRHSLESQLLHRDLRALAAEDRAGTLTATQESNCFSAVAIVVSGPCPGRTRVSAGRGSRYSPIAFSCPAKSGNSPSWDAGPSASRTCPVNTAPRSSQYRHTEPAV